MCLHDLYYPLLPVVTGNWPYLVGFISGNIDIGMLTRLQTIELHSICKRNRRGVTIYCNVPKFSDRQAWANSADPDQTAPREAV